MEFWKPMGFEPIIGRKDVTAFAIYEEAGTTMHDLIDEWLKHAASIYQVRSLALYTLVRWC